MLPGARLYISFPNPLRFEASLYQDKYDLPPNHLNIISRASALLMLQEAGFRVVRVVEEPITKSVFRLASNQFYALVSEYISESLASCLSRSRSFIPLKPLVFLPFVINCVLCRVFSSNRRGYSILYIAEAI